MLSGSKLDFIGKNTSVKTDHKHEWSEEASNVRKCILSEIEQDFVDNNTSFNIHKHVLLH